MADVPHPIAGNGAPLNDVYRALARELDDVALAGHVIHAALMEGALRCRMLRQNGTTYIEEDVERGHWDQLLFANDVSLSVMHSDDHRWYFAARADLHKILPPTALTLFVQPVVVTHGKRGPDAAWRLEVARWLSGQSDIKGRTHASLAGDYSAHCKAADRAAPDFDNLSKFISYLRRSGLGKIARN
jgi:hypothetical protein